MQGCSRKPPRFWEASCLARARSHDSVCRSTCPHTHAHTDRHTHAHTDRHTHKASGHARARSHACVSDTQCVVLPMRARACECVSACVRARVRARVRACQGVCARFSGHMNPTPTPETRTLTYRNPNPNPDPDPDPNQQKPLL
jgi:hypothetical protein